MMIINYFYKNIRKQGADNTPHEPPAKKIKFFPQHGNSNMRIVLFEETKKTEANQGIKPLFRNHL